MGHLDTNGSIPVLYGRGALRGASFFVGKTSPPVFHLPATRAGFFNFFFQNGNRASDR
jgi:hypothetical protein